MSKHLHIMANKGDVAETVLLPGDPLRAKFIAENFLEDSVCYNEVRGMYELIKEKEFQYKELEWDYLHIQFMLMN